MTSSLVAVARRLLFIRETAGANRGAWVEFLQRFTGGQPGDPWCADFVSFVLEVAFRGSQPLRPTGSTRGMLVQARTRGWVVDAPRPEDLYFFVRADGTPHHVGIVTSVLPLAGIAGNTSEDGVSSEGTGVFEHAIGTADDAGIVFVRLPTG